MNRNYIIMTIGIISILICLGTWAIDWLKYVPECIYCRFERTIIGLLGLIILFQFNKYLKSYISLVLGFFGAHLCTDQVFLNIQNDKINLTMVILASFALLIIIGQVWLIHYWSFYFPNPILKNIFSSKKKNLNKSQ